MTEEVKLGQNIFLTNRKGDITRTVVSKLYAGGYFLLDEPPGFMRHLSFEEATKAVIALLGGQINTASAERKAELEVKLKRIGTKQYREEVFKAPLIHDSETGFLGRAPLEKELKIPDFYFIPEEKVWVVITTKTVSQPSSYKPKPFFVLESTIQSVAIDLTKPNAVVYRLQSDFFEQNLHKSEREAKLALVKVFTEITGGYIGFENILTISQQEEMDHLEAVSRQASQNAARQTGPAIHAS